MHLGSVNLVFCIYTHMKTCTVQLLCGNYVWLHTKLSAVISNSIVCLSMYVMFGLIMFVDESAHLIWLNKLLTFWSAGIIQICMLKCKTVLQNEIFYPVKNEVMGWQCDCFNL